MKRRWLVPLLGVCLLASCRRNAPPESFNALAASNSWAPGGHYGLRAYRYQSGDRLAIVGFVERPGPDGAGPAFVALFRLPNRDLAQLSVKGESGGPAGAHVSGEYQFTPAGGNPFTVRYELKGEPAAEHWSLTDKAYGVEAGRVVLADLTKNPPEITQVRVDLANLFPTAEPTQEQMKAGLDKLRERGEEVRTFFGPGR